MNEPTDTAELLRGFVLAVLVIALTGIGIELVLLEHTEDLWQWVPLVLIGLALVELASYGLLRRPALLRTLQGTMVLFILSGILGVALHYRGNSEFELEMMPELAGLNLFREAISGATPVLAPGTMLQLGLLGLAYTFRHPALRDIPAKTTTRDSSDV